jgi:predicted permease
MSSEFIRRVRSAWSRLFGFRRRDALSERFAEETRYHIDMQTERNRAAGMSAEDARRAALVAFGGQTRYEEAARDEVRSLTLEEIQRDVRFSLRVLRRTPGFAVAAILTLALGIGASTVIFSLTDHVVLRPLAYPQADRLVLLREIIEEARDRIPSLPANASHFLAWRERCTACEAMGAVLPLELTLRGTGDPQKVTAARVSAELLPMLGARAQHGRLFTAQENADGANRVVVITDGFWRRQYGARTDLIGQTISLGGAPTVVIGILERGFALPKSRELGSPGDLPEDMDLFVPLALTQRERTTAGEFNYLVIARRAPNATVDRVHAQIEAVAQEFTARNTAGMHFRSLVLPLQEHVVGSAGRALVLLLAAVGALLLIVCVNLASLLLARNAARFHESAVRLALGAGRLRLVRQALTESLVLALLGGALGMLLSRWGLTALLHFAPPTLPRLAEIRLDGRVLAAALIASIVAGLIFGVLPALRFGRTDPGAALKSGGGRTATEGERALRVRELLVASQVGLSALLLVATGLFLASFMRVLRVDKGFTVGRALAVNVSLPRNDYLRPELRVQFYDDALARLRALPGVTGTAVATGLPLEGEVQIDMLSLENDPRPAGQRPMASIRLVSPSYFDVIGTPLREGRVFDESDRSRHVVILSERAARTLWPNESAIGKRMWPGSNDSVSVVVGVVADVRTSGLEQEGTIIAYVPHWQRGVLAATLLVRSAGDPAQLIGPVREGLRALAPGAPVSRTRTLAEVMAAALAQRRFQLLVLALFATTALATASVGIYGVVSQSLRRRTPELGVRMALGARPADVRLMVLREGLIPVAIGLAAGLTLSIALGGAVRALLFDVAPGDPLTLAGVALILALVAAVACWLPAQRATAMDLVRALRRD